MNQQNEPYHKLHDRHIDMMEEQDKPRSLWPLWLAIIIATNMATFVFTVQGQSKAGQVNMKLIQKIMHSEEFQLGPYSVEYKCFPVDKD